MSAPMNDLQRLLADATLWPAGILDAIEVRARQLTGRPHFGCIPAWAWRAAIAETLPALLDVAEAARRVIGDYERTGETAPPDDEWDPAFAILHDALRRLDSVA